MADAIRVEDVYIVARARALKERFRCATTELADIILDATGSDIPRATIRCALERTLTGRLVRRQPTHWTRLPWPYDLVHDRPCSLAEFRKMHAALDAGEALPPTPPLPKEAFPDPPDSIRGANAVTDATGERLGDEMPSHILEPRFENPKEVPTDLDGLVAGFKRAQTEKKRHERSQTRALIDLSNCLVPILVFAHSDVHWGSEDTDYDAIARHAEIAQRPNTYVFELGDLNEFAKVNHRGALEGQVHGPTVQARAARSWIVKVWPAILAALLGNHDMRVFAESGFDVGEYLFAPPDGKRPVPFMRDGGLVLIRHGTEVYSHNLFHGDSSFGTRFNENHKGRQVSRLVDGRCDVVWNGHTHSGAVQDTNEPSDDMGGFRDAVYCQAGSFKIFGDEYARRRKFLVVSEAQMPAVITFPDVHLVLPFKRVETAVLIHQLLVEHYQSGGSMATFWQAPRAAL